ncbi:complex I NDUFA9 subunit family protein [Calidithermus roseus]|uniref:N-acetyl-alpha-D-glucosaminyl-diphospho-ditrans, octacis-undecaprenol 4-epimerase n=1 Tax=Calidithermus roseus TaxID=1644118 RepID=A0A399EQ30_9DEIN|nr:complex I NDUFA9 subunit family protein [Calidithermus roseus]RIH86757.1 N-acetyl-alpha-D-glucosaminyl-diphospho-ditrans,octacis-undecaprenol 4-epimerase [Calidithermus roseus]
MNVLLIGGTGYVGSHLTRVLLARGHTVYTLSRKARPTERVRGADQGVRHLRGDAATGEGLGEAVEGMEAVVYLVALIRERGGQTFQTTIVDGVRNTLAAMQRAGVGRLLHMSALGAARGTGSRYFEAKAEAEELVRASSLEWTIFRPSLIFGEGDDFFGRVLKGLVRAPLPFIPQVGDGHFPFRPVWVGDVAEAFAQALEKPQTIGQTYELVGPKEYSFHQLLLLMKQALGSRKPILPIPLFLMDLAVPLMSPLPFTPITPDEYRMLKSGNTADPGPMRAAFKLEERSLEAELPAILVRR